jgi:hypothetical protein
MGKCCGANAAFESVTFHPALAAATASRSAERFLYPLAAEITPNSGIDAHVEGGADAAMDFGDVLARSFDSLTFRPALQHFQVNRCIRFQ